MEPSPFTGRVVVVAGADVRLPDVARLLVEQGALVAVVVADTRVAVAHASFAADPCDPAVWDRVTPYVEQRLGPIDGVVADDACAAVVEPVIVPDLRRRGTGDVVRLAPHEDAVAVLSRLADTLRAATA